MHAAAVMRGAAALAGEKDKHARYGGSVDTFAVEVCGRLGPSAWSILAALAREAADLGKLQPLRGSPAGLHTQAILEDIGAELVRAEGARTLEALGGHAVAALGWLAARAPAPASRWLPSAACVT